MAATTQAPPVATPEQQAQPQPPTPEQQQSQQQTQTQTKSKKATHRCDVCGRSFTSNAGLVIHKGRAHGGGASNGSSIGSDPLDGKLMKVLFPDGNMPIGKLADVSEWLETARKLRGDGS
jgi:hypothetical protein